MKILLILTVVLSMSSAMARENSDGPAVADVKLESRLVRRQNYVARPGDTLEYLGLLLYGHESWWRKIQDLNPALAGLGPREKLRVGASLTYMAPAVGNEYVVQSGDWLVRIAAWKYGDTSMWAELFKLNAPHLQNPNLIHPGDRLVLLTDGQVENRSTGQKLMNGLHVEAGNQVAVYGNGAPQSGAAPLAATQDRKVAAYGDSTEPSGPWWNDTWFIAGFGTGCLFLLVLPIAWLLARRKPLMAAAHAENEIPAAVRAAAKKDEYEDVPVARPRGTLGEFKKRPYQGPVFDRSLVHYEDGEVQKASGYQSLLPIGFRKYLKRRKKD